MQAPTIGRRVWLWVGDESGIGVVVLDFKQPLDAGVVFVHPDGSVNVAVTDHMGNSAFAARVRLREPSEADEHGVETVATWMPYQVNKAKAEAAQANSIKPAAPPAPPAATTKPVSTPAPTSSPASTGSTR